LFCNPFSHLSLRCPVGSWSYKERRAWKQRVVSGNTAE
jgi:hypothetical protein